MKTIKKTMTVYVADDGTEFINQYDCKLYENYTKNIKFFKVDSNPDLTETGLFCSHDWYCVYSDRGLHEEILQQFLMCNMKIKLIGTDVMGYGFTKHFDIRPYKDVEYFMKFAGKQEQIKNILVPTSQERITLTQLFKSLNIFNSDVEDNKFVNYYELWNLK